MPFQGLLYILPLPSLYLSLFNWFPFHSPYCIFCLNFILTLFNCDLSHSPFLFSFSFHIRELFFLSALFEESTLSTLISPILMSSCFIHLLDPVILHLFEPFPWLHTSSTSSLSLFTCLLHTAGANMTLGEKRWRDIFKSFLNFQNQLWSASHKFLNLFFKRGSYRSIRLFPFWYKVKK